MHLQRVAGLLTAGILLAGPGLAPGSAQAGVPRSCIHRSADRLECREQMRLERRAVLPWARVRLLERERHRFEREAPLEDRERNRLLRQIRDTLRCAAPGC